MATSEQENLPTHRGAMIEAYLLLRESRPHGKGIDPKRIPRQRVFLEAIKRPQEVVRELQELSVGHNFSLVYILREDEIERHFYKVKAILRDKDLKVIEILAIEEGAPPHTVSLNPERPVLIEVK